METHAFFIEMEMNNKISIASTNVIFKKEEPFNYEYFHYDPQSPPDSGWIHFRGTNMKLYVDH